MRIKRTPRCPKDNMFPSARRLRRWIWAGLIFALIASGATASALLLTTPCGERSRPDGGRAAQSAICSLKDLLSKMPNQLEGTDIGLMNLLCAEGLRGSENLDVGKCLARLDAWAEKVRCRTDQYLWDFRRRPQEFMNSEAKFRVLLLISVLQIEFGVHYNDRGERNCDFTNSRNAFIHGMIDDTNGGTCASMPVLYVAVGRRLGYPMSVVLAKTHIFARWEDPKTGERFNIEGTNARFNYHPDSYYRKWPYPISDAELKEGYYLKSLTPAEELACFLQSRGNCLLDMGRFDEAKEAFTQGLRLAPKNPVGKEMIEKAEEACVRGPWSTAKRP